MNISIRMVCMYEHGTVYVHSYLLIIITMDNIGFTEIHTYISHYMHIMYAYVCQFSYDTITEQNVHNVNLCFFAYTHTQSHE